MLEVHSSREALKRRVRRSLAFGTAIGVLYSVAAMIFDAYPPRRGRGLGWEPTLFDTLVPVAGGALMGLFLALLWPVRTRKLGALIAGLVTAIPFALSVDVSMTGIWSFRGIHLVVPAVAAGVLGLAIGAFMHDYDRPLPSDSDDPEQPG